MCHWILQCPLFLSAALMLFYCSKTTTAFATNLPMIIDTSAIPDTVTYPAAFLTAFRTGAALSVINQPRMPSIDDTTPVGSSVLRLPSGARVRLFYPANSTETSSSDNTIAPYCTNGRQTSDGMASLVGFQQIGLSFLLGHLADASSGCFQDAPMTSHKSNLLIYSHGYGGNMDI